MARDLATDTLIASILQLPLAEREKVYYALHESLIDRTVDHGPEELADEVEAAWSDEIARRIADIDSGRVKTIPAEEAERMIRGDAKPTV
ncbi:MAG TPA: addiction module protein [Lacipirellulaceae bacterium]|nr:addiction module protein [Lacipirellulaceae bacterium]